MTFPTPVQLDQWAAALTAVDWRDITHRLKAAIERDRRGGPNIPDGYPPSTRGGTGGTAELTPVEAAAHARAGDHALGVWVTHHRDEHHDATRNAIRWLEDVMLAAQACVNTLDKIEARAVPVDTSPTDWCSNHLRYGYARARFIGGLCDWCYRFQRAERFLPTAELLEKHEHGRVYDRDIIEARKNRKRTG